MCCCAHVLQEARLKQWQSQQRPSSTLDDFAAASGYGSFAADAMARVRARLAGYEDDDSLQQQQQQLGASEGQQGGAAADAPQRQQQQGEQSVVGGFWLQAVTGSKGSRSIECIVVVCLLAASGSQ